MYIPTYKQIILFMVGLVFIIALISRLSHVQDAPRSVAIYPSDARVFDDRMIPDYPLELKQAHIAGQRDHNIHLHDVWYSWIISGDWLHAEGIAELDLQALCRYMKKTMSRSTSRRRASNILWYLSLDADKFTQFRAQRINSYDEELEKVVAKSMIYVIVEILAGFGDFEIGFKERRAVYIFRTGNGRKVHFKLPSFHKFGDVDDLFVLMREKEHGESENTWVHKVWHALRVMFPALRNLYMLEYPHNRRNLTASEIKSVGSCVGVERLGINACVGAGQLSHLSGSAVGNSIKALIIKGLSLQDSDVDAICSLNMHELLLYHTAADARDHNLARILEHKAAADRLTKLHILFMDDTGISGREAAAIASLRNIRTLSLLVDKSECRECISRILAGTPVSAGLRELALDFPDIPPSSLDVVAGLSNVEYVLLSCKNVTGGHLSRLSAGAAGSSITRLDLMNVDVESVSGGLAAFENLTSLKLENYTAPGHSWKHDLKTLTTGTRQVRSLVLVNRWLPSSLMMLVAAKSNLEELVLAIDELSGSELHIMLTNKHRLRTLEITGGNVIGYGVDAIADLGALTTLKLENVTMAYDGIVKLVGGGSLQQKLQRRFRLHAKVPRIDGKRADALRDYGLEYSSGVVIL